MSIPYSMMNDEIRSFDQYMTYLALSTNTEVNVPKVSKCKGKGLMGKKKPDAYAQHKKKKDVVPTKKRSFTAIDNILLDPDKAVKLAESISLTKAKHQEKERCLHETHAIMVIESELNLKAKEVPKGSVEEALDHSKKLKGIETLSATA
ncbi:hypothetical protein Tco_1171426 [Tanacetum coccineum]